MDLPNILSQLRPKEEWSLNGDTLDGLTWYSPTPPPTLQEIEDYLPIYEENKRKKEHKNEVKRLLIESDWSELPSSIEMLDNAHEWTTYRIELKRSLISGTEIPSKPEVKWKEAI